MTCGWVMKKKTLSNKDCIFPTICKSYGTNIFNSSDGGSRNEIIWWKDLNYFFSKQWTHI